MIRKTIELFKLLVSQRELIVTLTKRELAQQYIGSALGFLWTIITPMAFIGVFWFVFSYGLKAQPLNNVPFVVWLTTGLAIWNFFSEVLVGSCDALIANSSLIKRTLLKSQILPVVKILSGLMTHIIFVGILIILILAHELPVTFFFFQSLYFLFCLFPLILGLSWLCSALNVFIRDTSKIVVVFSQILFWATPVFWDATIMPEFVQRILKYNPVYYLVQGYRDSFLYGMPFWNRPIWTAYYWGFSLSVLLIGAVVFQKLKPQFADVI
jgi:lipopolysaccharide transport system permease protein